MSVSLEYIRQYFIKRQRERNKFYKLLPKFDQIEVWQKLADNCKKLDVTEKFYIDFVFDELANARQTIFPKTLLNSKIIGKIKIYQETIGKQIQLTAKEYVDQEFQKAFSAIKNFLQTHPGSSHLTVLRMAGFQIPAWLRLSLAPTDPKVYTHYIAEARKELANIKGLKEAIEATKGLLNTSWI